MLPGRTGSATGPIVFVVTGTGNVGIGTTTPAGKLHVARGAEVDQNLGAKQDLLVNRNLVGRITGAGNLLPVSGDMTISSSLSVGTTTPKAGKKLAVTGDTLLQGNLSVSGSLTKGSGTFKIDHPQDPERKYLSHFFVESPEMKNVYDGVVTLDEKGQAWVQLPNYFEVLNRDFRYQLTAIGAPGPNLYVAGKISGNRFRIAGGKPGAEVSWQVSGVRRDAYAVKHPIQVEEEKPAAEQGYYLHPDAHGQREEKGIAWARNQHHKTENRK